MDLHFLCLVLEPRFSCLIKWTQKLLPLFCFLQHLDTMRSHCFWKVWSNSLVKSSRWWLLVRGHLSLLVSKFSVCHGAANSTPPLPSLRVVEPDSRQQEKPPHWEVWAAAREAPLDSTRESPRNRAKKKCWTRAQAVKVPSPNHWLPGNSWLVGFISSVQLLSCIWLFAAP